MLKQQKKKREKITEYRSVDIMIEEIFINDMTLV